MGDAVQVSELTRKFGDFIAVDRVTFDVADGEIFGFLGPNGAGKSTTQKVLIGLLSNYQGEVKALGRNLSSWSSDYYERIGVSFEFPNHFLKLTATENLRYFAALYSGKITEPQKLLDMVGLGSEANVPVGQFSKGMKNRLNIARSRRDDGQISMLTFLESQVFYLEQKDKYLDELKKYLTNGIDLESKFIS